MKLKICMTAEGMERWARGQTLYSWHFNALLEEVTLSSQYRLLGEVDVRMPSPEDCIVPVLEALAKREQEIRTESYEELQKIKQRRNDLMMLSAPVIQEAKESEL